MEIPSPHYLYSLKSHTAEFSVNIQVQMYKSRNETGFNLFIENFEILLLPETQLVG